MLPKDAMDENSAMITVRSWKFASERVVQKRRCLPWNFYTCYKNMGAHKGWRFEILFQNITEFGGIREAVVLLKGRGVYGRLKYECGVHRVQRIPSNDVRLHTSTMSIAVLPEMDEISNDTLNSSDLRIDVYRASGAGGQHVNTTESAVRITHLPTGLVAAVQDERSQHQNKAKAMKILSARVYDAARREQQKERKEARSAQIGLGDRLGKQRMNNYPHRLIFLLTCYTTSSVFF